MKNTRVWVVKFEASGAPMNNESVVAKNAQEAMTRAMAKSKPLSNCNLHNIVSVELIAEAD